MGTLIYSPDIQVLVSTDTEVLDLSPDIERFSVNRVTSAVSSFECTLNNKHSKYDRRIPRMARVVVFLRRIYYVQVFSGYTTEVPFEQVVPGSCTLKAACTLKRLQHTYWDPYTEASQNLLNPGDSDIAVDQYTIGQDGGAAHALFRVLNAVVGWEDDQIHIQKVPSAFLDQVEELRTEQQAQYELFKQTFGNAVGGAGIVGGQAVGTDLAGLKPFTGEQKYQLPHTRGKISGFGGPGGGAYGNMALTGESGVNPRDIWYCAMRWQPKANQDCYNWWVRQKLLITNINKPQYKIVVRPADWGPHENTGRVLDLSRESLPLLGAVTDDEVTIQLVDPSTPVGVVKNQGTASVAPSTGTGGFVPGQSVAASTGNLNWQQQGKLRGNTRAAQEFIQRAWPDIRSCFADPDRQDPSSDHGKGLALDTMVTTPGSVAQGSERALGTSIALWFAANIHVFGVSYVIWMDRIVSSKKPYWRPYQNKGGGGNTLQHRDHVHISFLDNGQSAPGPMGGGWTEGDTSTFGPGGVVPGVDPGAASSGAFGTGTGANPNDGQPPFTLWSRSYSGSEESDSLEGDRAWVNDQKILTSIGFLSKAALREFQSAPNGDFVAWFPDWFGIYGKTPVMKIRDVEIVDFKISLSDDPLITHVGVAGAVEAPEVGVTLADWMASYGIVSVENEIVLKLLLGVPANTSKGMLDSARFLERYGKRPKREEQASIGNHDWEMLYAVFQFMRYWCQQYISPLQITFMPELYPGMRIDLVDRDIQVYVESVTHSGSRATGFSTTARVSCPTRGGKPIGFLPSDVELLQSQDWSQWLTGFLGNLSPQFSSFNGPFADDNQRAPDGYQGEGEGSE